MEQRAVEILTDFITAMEFNPEQRVCQLVYNALRWTHPEMEHVDESQGRAYVDIFNVTDEQLSVALRDYSIGRKLQEYLDKS